MTGGEDTPTRAASPIDNCAPSRTTEHCRTKVLAHRCPGARRAPGLSVSAMTAPMTAPGTALPTRGTYCPTTVATAPNQLWCADFKGHFKTRDGKYCYPLTVTDAYSRYLIGCLALPVGFLVHRVVLNALFV